MLLFALVLGLCFLGAPGAWAEVVATDINHKEDVLGGKPFGGTGAYEKLSGTIHFAFDPGNPRNARIVDLDKAQVDASGRVRAAANFMVLRPKRGCELRCIGLLDVSNRGHKAALAHFNYAPFRRNPRAPADFGDGLLMRLGVTLIWLGWQFDVPNKANLLRLKAPIARDGDKPVRGLVRSDWTVDQKGTSLHLGHRQHIPYPVSDPNDPSNVLTVRAGRLAPRTLVARDRWTFARTFRGEIIPDKTHITMSSGFEIGRIYELVYVAENPIVVGLGLAAIRDVMSHAKHDRSSPFPVHATLAFGVSQTGRLLRHFIYQGFNTDEQGRKVFDGMLIHAAGAGRGSFNHRFAQPSRDAHRYSAFFYPTDLFPFSGRSQRDPKTGKVDGLYAHQFNPDHLPKVLYTNTGYEYWGRASSLIHTDPEGRADLLPLTNERIYHLASTQHFVGDFPPRTRSGEQETTAHRGNPLDFLVNLRALVVRLMEWVTEERAPPDSRYPRIADDSLVPITKVRFPALPGIEFPQVVHQAHRVDYGPRWERGIIDRQPPRIGASFPSLVANVDAMGNEIGGIRNVEIRVPLATYTPWSLRSDYAGAQDELVDFLGTYLPLAQTERERALNKDPRPSVESLYPSKNIYLEKVNRAAEALVEEGFLLREDIHRVNRRAIDTWELIH